MDFSISFTTINTFFSMSFNLSLSALQPYISTVSLDHQISARSFLCVRNISVVLIFHLFTGQHIFLGVFEQ